MHFVRAIRVRWTPTLRQSVVVHAQQQRTFIASLNLQIKETANRTPDELAQKKDEHVEKAKKGQQEWDPALASEGETNIAADKDQVHDHDQHIEELQKETAQKGEKGDI